MVSYSLRLYKYKFQLLFIFASLGLSALIAVSTVVFQNILTNYSQMGFYFLYKAHYHLIGISSFSLVFFIIILILDLTDLVRNIVATTIALINLYGYYWLVCFLICPFFEDINDVKEFLPIFPLVLISMVSLLITLVIILGNLLFGWFKVK